MIRKIFSVLYIIFGPVNTEPCVLAVFLVGAYIPEINVLKITIWEIYHVSQSNWGVNCVTKGR